MPSGRKPNLKRRQLAVRLNALGLPLTEIARRLRVTPSGASSLLRRAGIDTAAVLCHSCRTPITVPRRQGLRSLDVLCLGCLVKQPEVPFAQRLLALRHVVGLTQAELGRRAGVPKGTIASYEVRNREPDLDPLLRLAHVLGELLLQGERRGVSPPVTVPQSASGVASARR